MKNSMANYGGIRRLDITGAARASFEADRPSFIIFLICVLVFLFEVSLILVSWGKLPPQVPLFYSRPWGEAMLAPPAALFMLPAIVVVSVILNYALAIFLVADNKFLVRTLVIFSLLVSVTTLYSCVKIITLLT